MAKKTNTAPKKFKPKAITKGPAKAALNVIGFVKEVAVPSTPLDAAMYAVPWAKGARIAGGIVGKGGKAVKKIYRNIGK